MPRRSRSFPRLRQPAERGLEQAHDLLRALQHRLPRILWVSPHGDLLIADGMSTENQGAQLFLRTADGALQELPWKGLIHRPNQANIIEPSIAW
jgi:hypothetical protein